MDAESAAPTRCGAAEFARVSWTQDTRALELPGRAGTRYARQRRPLRKLALLPLCCALGATLSRIAWADETASTRSALAARGVDRPYTLAQLGLGLLTLPAADVCLKVRPCTKGDTTLEIDFWQMYRANRRLAVGAGGTLALRPTTDNPPSEAGIDRNHTRSYYIVEGQGRYYAIVSPSFEAWIGATAGIVIVSDRYSIDDPNKRVWSIIGPRASSVTTEGASVGALLGAEWSFAPNWAAGLVGALHALVPAARTRDHRVPRSRDADRSAERRSIGISCSYRIAL